MVFLIHFLIIIKQAFLSILQSFLKRGAKPPTVLLRGGTGFANVFEMLSSQLHIKCEKYPFLPHIEEFIDGFKNSIQNKKKLRKNTKKKNLMKVEKYFIRAEKEIIIF